MTEEEKEVLKTFKSGLGLTGVEHKILVNYIDKQQKVIDLMAEYIYEHDISTTGLYEWRDNEQIKRCFYKEVEEKNE